VNVLGHKLNGRLGGYYHVPVPQVSQATGYGPTDLDTPRFPPAANGWGTTYSIPDMVPPLMAEE
jgi:hypothetical protein